ncbi:hypothetical protein CABS03_13565 [Colletotrichum abscissum]|uniref:Uncharacterized protein n=1 Tax=Colletotrichum limetticola TaxID=1209924 RepID=A0ABQ9PCR1_9PEZI|nr:hypothetical protein CLIM01_13693 [Colletotrichum limetticola]
MKPSRWIKFSEDGVETYSFYVGWMAPAAGNLGKTSLMTT